MYFSYIGDNDVYYKSKGGKLTPQEGLSRFRFVLAKAFAVIHGGGILSYLVVEFFVKEILEESVTYHQSIMIILMCMVSVYFFIGVMENFVRQKQGRQKRPLIDSFIWRSISHSWSDWFKR